MDSNSKKKKKKELKDDRKGLTWVSANDDNSANDYFDNTY